MGIGVEIFSLLSPDAPEFGNFPSSLRPTESEIPPNTVTVRKMFYILSTHASQLCSLLRIRHNWFSVFRVLVNKFLPNKAYTVH